MGIYLPNMEMPKGCAFCRIGKRNGKKMVCPLCDEGWDIHNSMSADHRLDNCPLRPVQPHGWLIDADALVRDNGIKEIPEYYEVVRDAPTIIPAEEGE